MSAPLLIGGAAPEFWLALVFWAATIALLIESQQSRSRLLRLLQRQHNDARRNVMALDAILSACERSEATPELRVIYSIASDALFTSKPVVRPKRPAPLSIVRGESP